MPVDDRTKHPDWLALALDKEECIFAFDQPEHGVEQRVRVFIEMPGVAPASNKVEPHDDEAGNVGPDGFADHPLFIS